MVGAVAAVAVAVGASPTVDVLVHELQRVEDAPRQAGEAARVDVDAEGARDAVVGVDVGDDLAEGVVPLLRRRARLLDHRDLVLDREVALRLPRQEVAQLHRDLDRVELAPDLRGRGGGHHCEQPGG